jgi:hypothetical protein
MLFSDGPRFKLQVDGVPPGNQVAEGIHSNELQSVVETLSQLLAEHSVQK